jgi:hypothetical protein
VMGSAAIGAVSVGFIRRSDCGPGLGVQLVPGPDGRLIRYCQPGYGGVAYGGFGTTTRRFQWPGGGG